MMIPIPSFIICRFKALMSFVSKLSCSLPFTMTQSAAAIFRIYHQMSAHTHNWIHRAAGCLVENCRSALLCSPLARIFQASSLIQELGSLSPGYCSGCLFLSTHWATVITRPRRETASRINCMKKTTWIEIKSRNFKDVSNDEMMDHPKESAKWMPARSR